MFCDVSFSSLLLFLFPASFSLLRVVRQVRVIFLPVSFLSSISLHSKSPFPPSHFLLLYTLLDEKKISIRSCPLYSFPLLSSFSSFFFFILFFLSFLLLLLFLLTIFSYSLLCVSSSSILFFVYSPFLRTCVIINSFLDSLVLKKQKFVKDQSKQFNLC